MKSYKAYLIDLDGTIFRGNQLIEGADEFVEQLQAKNIPFRFVTNNSSRTPEKTVEHLKNLGIHVTPEHIITASMATANYIKEKNAFGKAHVIGEHGLFKAIEDLDLTITNDEQPDYVIMGIDRNINYEKIVQACLFVQRGAQLIATNPDIRLRTEIGFVPGNGSFVKLISEVTGVKPIVIGKPEGAMLTFALEQLKVEPSDAIMVGDNYDTDIQAGINARIDTLHVHTGVTAYEDLEKYPIQPTYSIPSLKDWKF